MLPNDVPNESRSRETRPTSRLGWRARLRQWLRGDRRATKDVATPKVLLPSIRRLEPRLVLNASAELNPLGQLLISGDAAADTVELQVLPTGDLQVLDGGGNVIPITNHPGVPTAPLAPTAITSGEIRVDLGDGNDTADLQLPVGLDVTVVDGNGDDQVNLQFIPVGGSTVVNDISVDAETITLNPPAQAIGFTNNNVQLSGNVLAGNFGVNTQILTGTGNWTLDGSLTLQGNLSIVSSGGTIDLSDTVVTSNANNVDLGFAMSGLASNVLLSGSFDDSGGQAIDDLNVIGAGQWGTSGVIDIDGQLSAQSITGAVQIGGAIDADSIGITSFGDIDVNAELASASDSIVLSTNNALNINGDLNSVSAGTSGRISLFGSNIQIDSSNLLTAGADIDISGTLRISGDVLFDSASGASATSGAIDIFGAVVSPDAVNDQLTISALGTTPGVVNVIGPIGGFGSGADLSGLVIDAGAISLNNVSITGGDILLTADTVAMNASLWRTQSTGGIFVDAEFTASTGNSTISSAGSVEFERSVDGQFASAELIVNAVGDIRFQNEVVNLNDLIVSTPQRTVFGGDLEISGDLTVNSDAGIEVAANAVTAGGDLVFQDDVTFQNGSQVTAIQIRTDGVVTTPAGTQTDFLSPLIDPIAGSSWTKDGAGTLVLSAGNPLTVATQVAAGTLVVNGSVLSGAGTINVASGARLEGDGAIGAGVQVQSGGTLAPGTTSGGQLAAIQTGDLSLLPGSVLELQISGAAAGVDQDVIRLDSTDAVDQSVMLGDAILNLTVATSQPPATEHVLIDNDGVDAINGRLLAAFDTSGNPLSTPRLLAEGDRVLDSFGAGAEPAFITYFGGDGNDLTIVTANDLDVASAGVTLVQRSGTNLEVRTGTTLAVAQTANPLIYPIAGLNNSNLSIVGSAATDTLFVDIDNFVDATGNTINFDGNIQFLAGESAGDQDRLVIFDSNPTSDDVPLSNEYRLTSTESGTLRIVDNPSLPVFTIEFDGAESFEQTVGAQQVDFQFTAASEDIVVDTDPIATDRTRVQTNSGIGSGTQFSIVNPTTSFQFDTAAGNDTLNINGFGTSANGMRSPLTLLGSAGNDSVIVNADLLLGDGATTGDLTATAETIRIRADIDTTGGQIDGSVDLNSQTSLQVDSAATIDVGDATINLDAGGGEVNTSASTLRSFAPGEGVVVQNASDVSLGNVFASGTLRLGQSQNITGFVSQAVGTQLEIDRLTTSTADGIHLDNAANQIRLVENVLSRGEIRLSDSSGDMEIANLDSSSNDVAIETSGSLLLRNQAVTALGATADLTAGQGVEDIDLDESAPNIRAGSISLFSGTQGIGQSQTDVDIVATEVVDANTALFGSDISLSNRFGDLPIGHINAGSGDVALEAVSINDANINSDPDLTADQLTMTATLGIGNTERLELQNVTQLAATTQSGGVDLDWRANAATRIDQLLADSGDIRVDQTGNRPLDISRIQNVSDSVRISNDAGIDVVGGVSGAAAVSVGGPGQITIEANGVTANLSVRQAIQSATGDILLSAGRNVTLGVDGDVSSASGNITVLGDRGLVGNSAQIAMVDGAILDAGTGVISVRTDGDISLGSLQTLSSDQAAVEIESRSGNLFDGGDTDLDIVANSGDVTIRTALGIGESNAIDTQIRTVDASSSDVGAIRFNEADDIELVSVTTEDGAVEITAGGTVLATQVISANVGSLDDPLAAGGADQRDVSITATGVGSDVLVGEISALNGADVLLVADDDILDTDPGDANQVTADDLVAAAGNNTADQSAAIDLSTQVNDVELMVNGSARGDIEIRETDSLNLAASDRESDAAMVRTSNGEIRIVAGTAINVFDLDSSNEGGNLTSDAEIAAGGDHGRLRLNATESISLGDAVQIDVSQVSVGAVTIETVSLELGEQFEINTGDGVGVARIFAPRPDVGLVETAFYESTSVSTNILEQAAVNDAEGQLTLDIGNAGERGLTLNIDWGADTERFQQIDGLSGDAPLLTVAHVYLERDILESRLNDRVSETAPLNVKFSVRHHESILVLGDSIQQAESEVEIVQGLRVSSTDNPLTAESSQRQILENGTAEFIIPSLSIPVAFFPVRDVIPEVEEPVVFVRREQTIVLSQSGFETSESSVSSSVGRDEFFQIRVLSPDPDGEDLVSPERLPDDILDGDKLRELLSRLPDGRYEIEYVLGDGNERSILQVDLRDGKPIIASDDLEEGPLRLREINEEGEEVDGDEAKGDDAFDKDRKRDSPKIQRIKETLRHVQRTQSIDLPGGEDSAADLDNAEQRSEKGKRVRSPFSAASRFSARANSYPAA